MNPNFNDLPIPKKFCTIPAIVNDIALSKYISVYRKPIELTFKPIVLFKYTGK